MRLLLFIALYSGLSSSILAEELWQCGVSTYTNRPKESANCAPIESAALCGNKGAKYYTPGRPGLVPRIDHCSQSGETSSPFVNLVEAEIIRKENKATGWRAYLPGFLRTNEKEKKPEKKFVQAQPNSVPTTANMDPSSIYSTLVSILNGGAIIPPNKNED